MLLRDFISEGTASLESIYPVGEARAIVMALCAGLLGVKSYTHIIEPGTEVPAEHLEELEADMERLRRLEPLQYVLGYAEFCGFRFNVSPAVLIPRPETEELVDLAVRESPSRVLDLCTGSGCIAWSVALSVPGCRVTAVDISETALDVARAQDFDSLLAGKHAVRPEFMIGDVLSQSSFGDGYDVVVSNPPYVMESQKKGMRGNVLDYEPGLALFVPDTDPLIFYRAVADHAARSLVPGGRGFVEINDALGSETAALYRDRGFEDIRLLQDISGRDRMISFKKSEL